MTGPSRSPLARTLSFILAALLYLCLAWNAVMLAFLIAVIGGIKMPEGVVVMTPLPVAVTYLKESESSPGTVIPEERAIVVKGHTDIIVDFKEKQDRVILAVVMLILSLGALLIVRELRAILREVKSGRPFSAENPKRLKRIGWLVLALGPLEGGWAMWMASRFLDRLAIPGATLSINLMMIHFDSILLGLLILLIARIFELGVRLQEEQDLTV
ncbi:MAG: hypothetical protein A2Z86_09030 [Candidatus Glassbacteria bacterium GWA2_58_10]|uniref:DUF2975 domain-containing protein n=1 Tax=Candidatus Glassbacteria bacterium GWA2_58_10 TaxID=1817865 RepID=A0A1F5YAG9_9BACT|nr:MAG: hypothetical protein A2Z86_09030 [Candidatus Glassbacteria bacterium GWA2_58_10]